MLAREVLERLGLVAGAQGHAVELQLQGAALDRRRPASAEQSDADSGAPQQLEGEAVVNVEGLGLHRLAFAGRGAAVDQAAVGEHAVDVADEPLDPEGALTQLAFAHAPASPWRRRPR